jgi:hypothetical protein
MKRYRKETLNTLVLMKKLIEAIFDYWLEDLVVKPKKRRK